MHIATIVYIFYGSVSLILYLAVFAIIHHMGPARLCGAFSKLILLYSVVNILTYINSWYSHRLRGEPLFWPVYLYLNTNDSFRNALMFLLPMLNYNQSVCNLLLTLNRFTAINFPLRHTTFWNRLIWPVMLISMAFGSISALSRLPIFVVWKYSSSENLFFIQHLINLNAFWYQIGFCSVLLAFCIVMNSISLVNLRKLGGSKSIKETERAFFFVSLFTFIAECGNLVMLTGKQLSQSANYTELWIAFNTVSPYATDVCSLGLPYYLLLVKGPIQHRLLKSVNCLWYKALAVFRSEKSSESNTIASRSRACAS